MARTSTATAIAAVLLLTACGPQGGADWLPGFDRPSAQAVRQAVSDPDVKRFYEQRGWKAAWSNGREKELIEAIEAAQRHGIDAQRFLTFLDASEDKARNEASLTLAALAYAEALSSGMIEPRKVHGIYELARPKPDLAAGLNQAIKDRDVSGWLESLAPHDAEYEALSRAYVQATDEAAEGERLPADRIQQLALNLERRRWLAREAPGRRVDVNTAAALLGYYRDGRKVWATRTVVGRPHTATPLLGSPMFQLVVNPPWNVPEGIAAKEILPKGPGYMAANDMYFDGDRVVQRPGPKAALGAVKFDLRNRHAIYLHDTPAKALFAGTRRHLSHGCVRVENALEFARKLAAEEGKAAEFDAKLASGETGVVELKENIPVRLLYHTVYLDDAGSIVFLPDPYGWDDRLARALGMTSQRRMEHDAGVSIPLGP